ncbi:MAG: hypothetical protein ABIH23_18115 [bacterium]
MKRAYVFSFVFLIAMSLVWAWAAPTPRTHLYTVEYMKPTPGTGGMSVLTMVFYVDISPSKVESFLKAQLSIIKETFPPKGDIMALASKQLTGDPIMRDSITLPDGSGFVIFSKSLGQVLSEREYDKAKKG